MVRNEGCWVVPMPQAFVCKLLVAMMEGKLLIVRGEKRE